MPACSFDPSSRERRDSRMGICPANVTKPQNPIIQRHFFVDEPARGDQRHPGAEQRKPLTAEEEPIVAMMQRSKDRRQRAGPRCAGGGITRFRGSLHVFWLQAGPLCDSGQHPRTNFIRVVECKHKVGPARTNKNAMGPALAFNRPADPQEGRKHLPPFAARHWVTQLPKRRYRARRRLTVIEPVGDNGRASACV